LKTKSDLKDKIIVIVTDVIRTKLFVALTKD